MQAPRTYLESTERRAGAFVYTRKNRGKMYVDESSHPTGIPVDSLHVRGASKGPMPPQPFLAASRASPAEERPARGARVVVRINRKRARRTLVPR